MGQETEWFVIDERSGEIVNCITVLGGAKPTVSPYDAAPYRLDKNPPLTLLKRYRYWDERP